MLFWPNLLMCCSKKYLFSYTSFFFLQHLQNTISAKRLAIAWTAIFVKEGKRTTCRNSAAMPETIKQNTVYEYFQMFAQLYVFVTSHSPPPAPASQPRSSTALVVLGVTQGCISLSVVWENTPAAAGLSLGSMCDSNFTQPGPLVPEVGH